MTRVDFYLLEERGEEARVRAACRTAEKAYRMGHRVHVHMEGHPAARNLDEQLWTFRDRSFIPHRIMSGSDAEALPPVTIGYAVIAQPLHDDVLINLAAAIPENATGFRRVIEILDQSPDTQAAGRQKYRSYRDQGCTLTHHRVGTDSA